MKAPTVAGEIATRVDVEPTIFAFDDLAVGQRALLTREVVAADRGLDGAAAPFGQAIGVGAFTLGLVAEVLGTRLPGPGAVYLSQTSQFLAPVQAGDVVTAQVEVVELVPSHGRARLFCECLSGGRAVFEGEAWIALKRRPGA